MILNLEIGNYRSFKYPVIFTMEATDSNAKNKNLCLLPIDGDDPARVLKSAVIFGANASGKTNMIHFLYRLKKVLSNESGTNRERVYFYDPFKFDYDSKEEPAYFTVDFICDNIKYYYHFEYDHCSILNEELYYSPNGKSTLLFERIKDTEEEGGEKYDLVKMGSIQEDISIKAFNNQLILSKFIIDTPHPIITKAAKFISNMIVINGYHPDMYDQSFDEVIEWINKKEDNKKRLSQLLAFTDTGVKSFEVKENPDSSSKRRYEVTAAHALYRDKIKTGDLGSLPLYQESFGTRSLFILGGKILQALDEGLPVFVDEIDAGLHTYLTKLLTDLFRYEAINSKNAQLILTTHDINLLDESVIRRDQVWFTEKDEYGCSTLFSLADFEDVREDTPFAKWYMSNKLGAVPSIQSLEKLFSDEE